MLKKVFQSKEKQRIAHAVISSIQMIADLIVVELLRILITHDERTDLSAALQQVRARPTMGGDESQLLLPGVGMAQSPIQEMILVGLL